MTTYRFELFGEAVDFVDCREVADGFSTILRGWDLLAIDHDPKVPAFVTFRHENGIYDWNTPWKAEPGRRAENPSVNLMEAICDFHYEFIDWFVDRNPHDFCVHMAAVEFAGRAILFPAIQKTGKSTLSLHCVHRGHRLVGDDVVAIDQAGGYVSALGLLPRMRLPLHPSFSRAFRTFFDARAGLSDMRWQYVELSSGSEILPFGTCLPIGGIVILDRREKVRAAIEPIAPAHALKALIDRNFAALADPGRIFDTLKTLALAADCRRLIYSDPEEAVDRLEEAFGSPTAAIRETRYAS